MTDRTEEAADSAAAPDDAAAAPADHAAAPVTDPLSGVLSAREAAVALGISERTVRRAIQRGDLAATKHAGSFHITLAALNAFQRRSTGQRVLSRAATADTTGAAAQDRTADSAPADAAAADRVPAGSPDTAAAISVLRELLAEERQKSDRLLEASTIWQTRALQLETQLKALQAGPISQDAGETSSAEIPMAGTDMADPTWRRWWRRMTGGG